MSSVRCVLLTLSFTSLLVLSGCDEPHPSLGAVRTLSVTTVADQGEAKPTPSRDGQDLVAEAAKKLQYVGRDVCKECHEENHRLHSQSGHATTFLPASAPEVVERFAGTTFDAGEPFGEYVYSVEGGQLQVKLADRFDGKPFPLQYALGGHAYTLLTLVPDGKGGTVGIEHKVSWHGTDQQMGITPGQEDRVPAEPIEHFGIPIRGSVLEACIGCHTTTADIVGQSLENLIPNVNCERCHGPGSEHVRQARLSQSPPPYAVGRDDWTIESEIRLCGSCHRMPANVSRKELRQYPKELIRFQPVGLLRSECYLESDGKMGCTTCHNPHMNWKAKPPAEYEQNCIDCHQANSPEHVACPVSTTEGCVECHMPIATFDHDIQFHDHWIRVHPH